MKKYISVLLFLLFTITFFVGCNSSSNEDNNDNQDNTPTPPVEEEILPTGIEISLGDNSIWTIEETYIYAHITPSNATNKDVEWTFSDPTTAYIYDNDLCPKKAGKTTITATTCNGISATVEFEVKDFCSLDFDYPLTFEYGSATYQIKDFDFSWYEYKDSGAYSEKIQYKVDGQKIADTKGDNNGTTGFITDFNLYDKDGYMVNNESVFVSTLFTGDKFKDDLIFYDVPKSGAPYTLKWVKRV